MQAKLTAVTIRSLRARNKPYEVVDTEVKGFLLRIQPSGVMTYYFSYRNEQSRRARYRIGKHGAVTPAQARDEALRLSAKVITGKDIQAEKKQERLAAKAARAQTLSGFLQHQYGPWVTSQRKTGEATLKRIHGNFRHLFERPLNDINAWVIEKWRSEVLKAGKAKSTVNRDLAALKACLAKAVEWELLNTHPLAKVRPLRTDRLARVRYLTDDEERRLRDALVCREEAIRRKRRNANEWRRVRHRQMLPDFSEGVADYLQPVILLAINTGLRRGELFQLTWKDVDFSGRTLTVQGRNAKSGQTRHIPLNDEAQQVLKRWHLQAEGETSWVFHGRNGKQLTTIRTSWRGILKSASVNDFRFHDLRHHFASRLAVAGVDLNTIRELLGHTDLEMTLRYAHLSPDHKAEAVGRLNEISSTDTSNDFQQVASS